MRVSFVIPTFNNSAWLPHAVKSCQDQTYKDIEIVIIDDCSTDTTDQYIKWLLKQDKRIVYKRNDKNMGRSYSRNLGNNISTGDIICVNDSDDLSINQRAEWTVKKMKKCQVCFGSVVLMDAIGTKAREIIAKSIDPKELLKPIDLKKWTEMANSGEVVNMRENNMTHSSMGFLREIALKYPYSEGIVSDLGIDDWEQQIRMMRDGIKFDFIPDVICAYRVHSETISQTRDHREVIRIKSEILEGIKC